MKRKAFTLTELILVVLILITVTSFALTGASCLMSGGSDQGSLLVNPLHKSTVLIRVVKSYVAIKEGTHVFRIFAQVLEDSDGDFNLEGESFQITDSWMDGEKKSADIFGRMQDKHTYRVQCRGERSGTISSFRAIVSAEHIAAPEKN